MKKINILKRVWQLCLPFRLYLVGALGFILAQQLIGALFPLILGSVVTAIAEHNLELLVALFAAWALVGTIRSGLSYLRERLEIRNLDYVLLQHLSRVSMKKFFSISMGQHHLGHSIIKRSVMSKGEAAVEGIVRTGIYEFIPISLSVLLPISFSFAKSPLVGLWATAAVVCFVVYTIRYNQSFVPKIRLLDTLSNQVAKKRGEMVENVEVIYTNAQEDRVRQEINQENLRESSSGQPVWLSYVGWFQTGQWFIFLSQIGCVSLSGYLAYCGQIASGDFVTLAMWLGSALGTLNNISHIQRNLARSWSPLLKYFRFLDYEPDIVLPTKPIPIEHLKGRIEFRRVSFAYRPRVDRDVMNDDGDDEESNGVSEIPALKDISFVLQDGRRYAFVGKSGAGKSTLVGLILRAYDPQEGHVFIDGVDVRMLDYRELRRNVGLVPQEVALFDGTMKYNVTFGLNGSADKVTEEELSRVAKLSRVAEFSDKLEQGWETVIGERGVKLSGGQKQRVGIARALIKNPRILIFDEATSSLDTENEAKIRESIEDASVGKTTIIIAHRLATVRDADSILVFDDGRIVGQGSHEELLASNDYYQRLVQNQVIMA